MLIILHMGNRSEGPRGVGITNDRAEWLRRKGDPYGGPGDRDRGASQDVKISVLKPAGSPARQDSGLPSLGNTGPHSSEAPREGMCLGHMERQGRTRTGP